LSKLLATILKSLAGGGVGFLKLNLAYRFYSKPAQTLAIAYMSGAPPVADRLILAYRGA